MAHPPVPLPLLPLLYAAAQHVQRPSLTLEQEEEMERKDADLGSLLDRLGGSIHGKALNISPSKVPISKLLTPTQSCL
jgi:hypothetical protein